MKKTMIFAAIAAMMMQAAPASACAITGQGKTVKVSIEIGSERVVSTDWIEINDMNGDGKIMTDEVLTEVHDLYYPGGASAGLGSGYVWGKRGSFITEVKDQNGKLRVDNPQEYEAGKAAPMFSQEVSEYDTVHCFAIALDPAHYELTVESPENNWSIFQNVPTGTSVTFGAYYYDPAKQQPAPVSGIELMMNGKGTGIKTGQDGKAALTFTQAGDFDITGNFDASKQNGYTCSYPIHVIDEKNVRQVQVIVRTDHLASDLNAKVNVYDADNDGSINAKDAYLCTTEIYYPVGNYPNSVFGTDGKFICNVSDAKGNQTFSAPLGDGNKKAAVENGYVVEFALEDLPRTEKRAVPAEAAQTTAPAATTAAAETVTTAAATSAAQTAAAAATTAAAETAVQTTAAQTTAAPAQTTAAAAAKTNANGSVKTGSLQTGDSAPLLAAVVCMLSGLTALVFRRKRSH